MSEDLTRTSHGGPVPDRGAAPLPHIGHYRVLRVIGEGGMGTVYEAEQENPRRIVALKVIRPGFATGQLLRRFELESHVLGRLQHPGIAQIFEAGTADDGHGAQPYFAMELVRGKRLDEHAAERKLDTHERLDLLARVCDAVEHAHQKGIVHRDLKPGNILVDASGQPKILDFGVARATDSDVQATMHTEAGAFIGTLPYMSPEQVGADPEQLDTRSDVYALGVILYELLSGSLPYDLRQKALPEAVRIIREEDPTRLTVVDRSFRGDVETIAAKALSKEKERRYQSAAELAADIRRHLNDEPIVARPASTTYQLRKFARRNKALVVGVVVVFAVLVAGVAVSSWQAVRATRAEKVATQQRLAAESETKKAAAVNGFLQDMLASANPGNLGKDATVRQALDESAKKVEGGALRDQPEIEAAVRATLGRTYQSLGLYAQAEPHLQAALETRKKLLGPDHPDVAKSLNDLASLLHDQGDLAAAEPLYREALRIHRSIPGDPDVAVTLNDLALLLFHKGDLASAEPLYRESIAIQERTLGPENPELAMGLNNLAGVLQRKGDMDGAEAMYRRSLAMRRKVLGDDHPDTAQGMSNLAALLQSRGQLTEAESLYRESVAVRRKVLGDEHPDTAISVNNLASVLRDRGDFAGAEAGFREALSIWRKTLGPEHPTVATGISNVGLALQVRGDLREAEAMQRESLAIRTRVLGEEHLDTARSMSFVAGVLIDEGRLDEAEPLLRRSLAIRTKQPPPRGVDISSIEGNLGLCLIRSGRPKEAEPLLRDALSIREEKLPATHWRRFEASSLLGEALAGQKRFDEAEPLLVRGYDGMKDAPGPPPSRKREARERVARLYEAWGKPEKAAAWR